MKNLLQHVTELTEVIDINIRIVFANTHFDDILSTIGDKPEFSGFGWHWVIMPAYDRMRNNFDWN
jgi:hypothetical protein